MSRYSLNSSFENVKISYQNIPPLTLSPFVFTYFLFIWSNIIHSQYLEFFFFFWLVCWPVPSTSCWSLGSFSALESLNLSFLSKVMIFAFFFFFNCSGFCHTLTWISHGFTCVLMNLITKRNKESWQIFRTQWHDTSSMTSHSLSSENLSWFFIPLGDHIHQPLVEVCINWPLKCPVPPHVPLKKLHLWSGLFSQQS